MKIIHKKTAGTTVTLQAVASVSDVEKAFEAAHVAFAQRMSLKPDGSKSIAHIARERFGLADLDTTVASQITEYLIPFAVDKVGLIPAYPAREVAASPARRGSELTFTCEFVLKTDLTLSSYEPVTVRVPSFVLVEEQVDKQIDEMALAYAEFVEIEPRPARMGDSCLLTIQAQEGYTSVGDLSSEKAIYTLGSGLISAEFDEYLVGMSADECKEFTLEMVSLSEDGALRTIEFFVQVLEVRERSVPVIDDAWIKQNASGVSSLEEFKDLLRKEFNKSYQQEYNDMVRQEAVSELAQRYTGLIADEALLAMQQTIINNLQSKAEQEGSSLDDYIKESGGEQQFNVATLMQSKEALAQAYALDALFIHEKMVLTDEDIRKACRTFDAENPDMIRKQMEHSGCGYMLRETAERLKAGTWLVEHAEVLVTEAA